MSTKWLAIQSFQYDRSLIAAINTLSIHLKLELAGISNVEKAKEVNEARNTLSFFLEKFESLTSNLELANTNPLTGTNQGLRQLAQKFVSAKNNPSEFNSMLSQTTMSQIKVLLRSEITEDKEVLILYLQGLRRLIEEHIDLDTETIFGEV